MTLTPATTRFFPCSRTLGNMQKSSFLGDVYIAPARKAGASQLQGDFGIRIRRCDPVGTQLLPAGNTGRTAVQPVVSERKAIDERWAEGVGPVRGVILVPRNLTIGDSNPIRVVGYYGLIVVIVKHAPYVILEQGSDTFLQLNSW